MATLITNRARAYVNWGKWVADCPANCGGALALERGQATYLCQECGLISLMDWPSDVDEITEALAERAAPRNRNWFPDQHELAMRSGSLHGQTPEQLREEAREHGVDSP